MEVHRAVRNTKRNLWLEKSVTNLEKWNYLLCWPLRFAFVEETWFFVTEKFLNLKSVVYERATLLLCVKSPKIEITTILKSSNVSFRHENLLHVAVYAVQLQSKLIKLIYPRVTYLLPNSLSTLHALIRFT